MGTLERLRDAVREKTDPVSTVMLIKEWEQDGFPGYEGGSLYAGPGGTLEALEVKHRAVVYPREVTRGVVQMEEGGPLYQLRESTHLPTLTKIRVTDV